MTRHTMDSYADLEDGKWYTFERNTEHYRICSDCSLTHREEFRIRKGRIQYRLFRVDEETQRQRRRKRIKVKRV